MSSRQHDILSEALGKDDHSGRVRGYGVYVTTRDVFGRLDDYLRRSCGVVSVDDIKDIIRKEMEDSITERVRHQTMSEMQSKFDSMQSAYQSMQSKYDAIIQRLGLNVDAEPDVTAQPRPPTRSSCHSVNPDPFDGLQVLTHKVFVFLVLLIFFKMERPDIYVEKIEADSLSSRRTC